jgi:hypothetical protein
MKFRRNANLNMPSGVDRSSIAIEFKKCINYFDRIHDIFDKTGDGIDPYKNLRNELDRIKGWSETNSAHRQGPTSLDYRLRDAPKVKDIILNLLVDLNNALEEGKFRYNYHSPRCSRRDHTDILLQHSILLLGEDKCTTLAN